MNIFETKQCVFCRNNLNAELDTPGKWCNYCFKQSVNDKTPHINNSLFFINSYDKYMSLVVNDCEYRINYIDDQTDTLKVRYADSFPRGFFNEKSFTLPSNILIEDLLNKIKIFSIML